MKEDDDAGDEATPARARTIRRFQAIALRAILAAAGATGVACAVAAVAIAAGAGADLGAFLPPFAVALAVIAGLVVLASRAVAGRSTSVADAFFRQQDRLILSVAHELRGPLGRAFVSIDEGLDGAEEPEEALRHTVAHVEAVSEMLADLLEMARVMSGALEPPKETFSLARIVQDVTGAIPVGSATIELDIQPAMARGSPRLMRRAVSNLIQNASRHAYRAGPGTITVRVGPTGVTVLDDGPGVTDERLVDIAYETPLTQRKEGAGLGLTICGWVAEMHGGRLVLGNRPGGGFSARIALQPSDGPTGEGAAGPTGAGTAGDER